VVELAMLLHSAISAGTYLAAKRAARRAVALRGGARPLRARRASTAVLLLARPPRSPAGPRRARRARLRRHPAQPGLFLAGSRSRRRATPRCSTPRPRCRVPDRRLARGGAATPRSWRIGVAFAGWRWCSLARAARRGGDARAGSPGRARPPRRDGLAVYVVFGKAYVGRYGVVTTTGLTIVIGRCSTCPRLAVSARPASARSRPWDGPASPTS